jgi:hypothetical protein
MSPADDFAQYVLRVRKLMLAMTAQTQSMLGDIRGMVEDVRDGKRSFEELLDYLDREYAALESGADQLHDDAPADPA